MVGVSAKVREAAGVAGGDEVDVTLSLDTEPREVVVPSDLTEALAREPEAARAFDALSYSRKRFYVDPIEEAKTPETRLRRIQKAVEALRPG